MQLLRMPNTLGRNLNLNLCFTKIKIPLKFSLSPPTSSTPIPSTPKDHSRPLSPSSSLNIIRNFNSLFEDADQEEDYTSKSLSTSSSLSAASDNDERFTVSADFAAAFASRRFFFSTPGRSNSIVDSAGERRRADVTLFGNSVDAVPTFSPDPYSDFRRSMQEMLEAARGDHATKFSSNNNNNNNWELLHELLSCYLALNPKSTHKFIIRAFSDLVVSLMPSLPDDGQRAENGRVADVCEIPVGR